jgi:two-component system KDP operon response regulator KdpE
MAVTNARVQSTRADVSRYRRVLLVEDEPVLRTSIRRNLELRGVFVTEAGTVGEALTSALGDLPDLLVLDINLPDGSGWDFLRELRASGSVPPTVVMSAGRVSRTRLREFGIEAFLVKPFLIDALVKLVTVNPSVPDR